MWAPVLQRHLHLPETHINVGHIQYKCCNDGQVILTISEVGLPWYKMMKFEYNKFIFITLCCLMTHGLSKDIQCHE